MVNQLAKLLISKQWMLTTAESCTGGSVSQLCTDLSGSSLWFERGFITYSNSSKTEMLGVDASLIEKCGAVSQEVAEAMAKGAIVHSKANCSVAITGIAGPSGGSKEKPVGTVWIAWSTPHGLVSTCFCFEGNRQKIREQAAHKAIESLINQIKE